MPSPSALLQESTKRHGQFLNFDVIFNAKGKVPKVTINPLNLLKAEKRVSDKHVKFVLLILTPPHSSGRHLALCSQMCSL